LFTFEAREPVVISIVWTIEYICIVGVYMYENGIISPNYPQTPIALSHVYHTQIKDILNRQVYGTDTAYSMYGTVEKKCTEQTNDM
jgi:hypothetical protein